MTKTNDGPLDTISLATEVRIVVHYGVQVVGSGDIIVVLVVRKKIDILTNARPWLEVLLHDSDVLITITSLDFMNESQPMEKFVHDCTDAIVMYAGRL